MDHRASTRVWKLTKASALAVVACCVAGGAALGVLTPNGTYIDPMWWIGAVAWWTIVSAPFATAIGLPQGVLLSALANRLRKFNIIYYIGIGVFVAVTSSLFSKLMLGLENTTYYWVILISSLSGSVTFWMIDRPDRVSGI
jgi:hypothetical protein